MSANNAAPWRKAMRKGEIISHPENPTKKEIEKAIAGGFMISFFTRVGKLEFTPTRCETNGVLKIFGRTAKLNQNWIGNILGEAVVVSFDPNGPSTYMVIIGD